MDKLEQVKWWFCLVWYNQVKRRIHNYNWPREWADHPEWAEEFVAGGGNIEFHPGKFRAGKLQLKDIKRGLKIAEMLP